MQKFRPLHLCSRRRSSSACSKISTSRRCSYSLLISLRRETAALALAFFWLPIPVTAHERFPLHVACTACMISTITTYLPHTVHGVIWSVFQARTIVRTARRTSRRVRSDPNSLSVNATSGDLLATCLLISTLTILLSITFAVLSAHFALPSCKTAHFPRHRLV